MSVAFSPERIDPGNGRWDQRDVPRVVGGVTERCARAAIEIVGTVSAGVHVVSSCEAAEMTKLYENTFRAVNIALANEMAGASRAFGLDPIEITRRRGDQALRLHALLARRRRRRALHPVRPALPARRAARGADATHRSRGAP